MGDPAALPQTRKGKSFGRLRKENVPSEIRRLTFRHFVSLGANGICAFKIAALPKETILRIAPLVNSEGIKRNILNGRGVVLAIAHMGKEEIPYDPGNPEQLTADINSALEQQIRRSPADWFWVHNRWKTPWPHLLIARQKRGIYLPPGTDPSKLNPFRFVVRSPNWLGDAVMSRRAALAFKHGRPDARLTVLTPAKLEAFWRSVPEVDEVLSFTPEDSVLTIAKALRGRFEAAILFPNSFRVAAEAWLAGIPRRVGFRGHLRSLLLTQIIDEPNKKKAARPRHQVDRYWHIAKLCGAVEPPSPKVGPRPSERNILGVCPGSEYGPAKRWPADRFRKTMELVSSKITCSWVIVGTERDSAIASEILQGFKGKAEDLTGKTSLAELIERVQTLRALLTNDTGTMHLADGLGVPLVAVFGSTEPRLTGPNSPTSIVLRHQTECSPCFLRKCPLDFRCMLAVAPEEAAHAIFARLDEARRKGATVG